MFDLRPRDESRCRSRPALSASPASATARRLKHATPVQTQKVSQSVALCRTATTLSPACRLHTGIIAGECVSVHSSFLPRDPAHRNPRHERHNSNRATMRGSPRPPSFRNSFAPATLNRRRPMLSGSHDGQRPPDLEPGRRNIPRQPSDPVAEFDETCDCQLCSSNGRDSPHPKCGWHRSEVGPVAPAGTNGEKRSERR